MYKKKCIYQSILSNVQIVNSGEK
uniref:Uncharacterized protein n=1 Tax=Rhizophora mucronata TaxID=61149 RepID=A0A2P2QRD3_RHIMU